MTISPAQAADALRDIQQTESRSRELEGYRKAAPILFIWGVISVIGYGATGVSQSYATLWLPLSLIGSAATVFIARRFYGTREQGSIYGRRIGWTWAAMLIFYFATLAVLRPHEVNQFNAFPALLVAVTYVLMGIWGWSRYTWLGAAMFVLTLAGYFFAPAWFSFWMAGVNGVGLILGGLWLRKA